MLKELETEGTIGIFVTFISLMAFQLAFNGISTELCPPWLHQCPPNPELIDFLMKPYKMLNIFQLAIKFECQVWATFQSCF